MLMPNLATFGPSGARVEHTGTTRLRDPSVGHVAVALAIEVLTLAFATTSSLFVRRDSLEAAGARG
jgi:hypothetical protein